MSYYPIYTDSWRRRRLVQEMEEERETEEEIDYL